MSAVQATRQVWTTSGGGNARRGLGFAPAIGDKSPKVLKVGSSLQASVVYDEQSRLYAVDMAGGVMCVSAEGKVLWRTTLATGISATPALSCARRRLWVGTHGGQICALDTATGRVDWSRDIGTRSDPRIVSDLLVVEESGLVVFSSWGERFHAVDADSGATRFSWGAGVAPRAAAAADSEGNVYCLRAVLSVGIEWLKVDRNGSEKVLHVFSEDRRGARRRVVAAPPVLDESRGLAWLVINDERACALHAWSLRDGKVLWSRALPHAVQAAPALGADGHIVVADMGGVVYAFMPDGLPVFTWWSRCEYLLAGGVVDRANNFYIGDPTGVVYRLSAEGKVRALFECPRAIQGRPSFSPEGKLVVAAMDGAVYVFG